MTEAMPFENSRRRESIHSGTVPTRPGLSVARDFAAIFAVYFALTAATTSMCHSDATDVG
jgi:hypothetical protein